MTLQYRTRNNWDDQIWQLRIQLANSLLIEIVDWWCQVGGDFPIDEVVASYLYLLSKRCSALKFHESGMRNQLQGVVGTSGEEYSKTWPQKEVGEKTNLLDALDQILQGATARWDSGTLLDPTVEAVNQQLVNEIVSQGYVTFHHWQTTRRDFGGFYGSS